MLALQDWSRVHINYELFWEKPPLFFWLQASSMSLFGVGAFAARFPNAVIGLLNLLLLYVLGQRLQDRRLGFFWALAWFGSLLPHLYAKSGLIDPLFNACMLLGLYGLLEAAWQLEGRPGAFPPRVPFSRDRRPQPYPQTRPAGTAGWRVWFAFAGAGLALGLAVLAKGPVGILLPGLTVLLYLCLPQGAALRRMPHFWLGLLLTGVLMVCTAGAWFLYDWIRNGPWFTESFLAYQWRLLRTEDAGHGGFPGYHPIVLLLGCFPASILALRAMPGVFGWQTQNATDGHGGRRLNAWTLVMVLLLAIVLLVFGLVQSKIVHYSSLAYYPITFLAALLLWQWDARRQANRQNVRSKTGLSIGLGLIAALWCLALVLAFLASRNPAWIGGRIADANTLAQWKLVDPLPWWTLLPVVLVPALTAWAIRSFHRGFARTGACVLFAAGAFLIQCSLWALIRPAEQLAQGPVVQWWSALAGEDVYRYSAYRSYAPFFYGQPPVPPAEVLDRASERAREAPESGLGKHGFYRRSETNREWLLFSDQLDKPVWIVAKAGPQADYIAGIKGMERMDQQGAYVLLRRRPQSAP